MATRSLRRQEIFTGLAVALVLFSATLDGAVAAVLAATLTSIGIVIFPEARRVGVLSVAVAIVVAASISYFVR